jgi:hypothetical protein
MIMPRHFGLRQPPIRSNSICKSVYYLLTCLTVTIGRRI